MTRIVEDRAEVAGPPDAVWAILQDQEALARILPGMDDLVVDGPGRFHGVIVARVQFLKIRVDIDGVLTDPEPPDRIRLAMTGRPRGLGGSFSLSVPMTFTSTGPATTRVDYAVDLEAGGQLAALGDRMIRDAMRDLIAELIANVDRELGAGPGGPAGPA